MIPSGLCHTPRRSFVVAEAVAARVVAEHPHPNAARLRIAVVEAGERRWRVVYGGTRRLAPGDIVPVALPGTKLTATSGLRLPPLRVRNFRGVRSEAMLCSSDELGWTRGGPDEVLVLDPGHEVGALVRRPSGRCHGPGCTQTAVVEFWCSERCQQVWAEQFQRPRSKRTGIPIYDDIMCTYEHLQEQRRPVYAHPDDAERVRRAGGAFPWLLDVRVSDIVPRGKVILVNEPVGEFAAFDEPPTFGPLPPAVDGDSEERVCEPFAPDPSRGWLSRTLDRLFGRTT